MDQLTRLAPQPIYMPQRAWIERLFFPRSRIANLLLIASISAVFSFLLTGRQIFAARWGLIDDHETFELLAAPDGIFGHVWAALSDPYQPLRSNRPVYYLLKSLQTTLFGSDVRLWYLRNTVCFAFFLSSIWWITARFLGGWLSGAFTAMIALLPLWAGVWSRLGPSEIEGAAAIAAMIFCSDAAIFSEDRRARTVGAIILAIVGVLLAGLKETFLPLAAGSVVFALGLSAATRRIPLSVAIGSIVVSLAVITLQGLVIWTNARVTGADYYGNSVGLSLVLEYTALGIVDGFFRTWWLWLLPVALVQLLQLTPRRTFRAWVAEAHIAAATYVFIVAMYAAQCGLYRNTFPRHLRYDFPAMLLVPLTLCILCCEISRRLRPHYPEAVLDRAQLICAIFLGFALATLAVQSPPALLAAIDRNVKTTSSFFPVLQEAARAARANPARPIILEAHGTRSFESVQSLRIYLSFLGAPNPLVVRFHAVAGEPPMPLQNTLTELQGGGAFAPLAETLVYSTESCMSIGLYGPPDPLCVAGITVPTD